MDQAAANSPSIPLAAVLELVAMQLEVALQNAAAQAERLSLSVAEFTAIGVRMRERQDPAFQEFAKALEAEGSRAMMAMQFHDQLAQRVTHVRQALGDVHDELLSGKTPDWNSLVSKMRAHYSMEDERRLFDLVLWAFPVSTAQRDEESLTSSVELF